jgi:tetratricopeptide (TPR) repeat protein
LNDLTRALACVAIAASATFLSTAAVSGAPRPSQPNLPGPQAPGPAPTSTGTPAPLPTATPEPAEVAIPRLEGKIKDDPNNRPALAELAGYYLTTGHPDKALGLTQRLLSLGEKTAQVYYLDGIANQSMGRIKEATEDFEQATNREPTNAQVLLTLTNLYLQTNRVADAERVSKRATTFNAGDKTAWLNYGLVLAQEKKYDEARVALESAAKIDPKDPEPVIMEARSYIDQNALALAGQLYDRALAIDPKSQEALVGKARLLANEHDVKGAIATYETLLPLIQSDEGKAAVSVEEARLYVAEKMTPEADAAIKKAVATYPNVPGVHVAYGDYLNSRNDRAGAEREWTIALGPKHDNPDALQRLTALALAQNQTQKAIDYLNRLGELLPNQPEVWAETAQVQATAGHYDKARDAYRRSFELTRSPQALAGMAASDYRLHNYKECSQIGDALDKGAPDFIKQAPEVLYVMGKCYAADRQRDKAKSAYTRFLPYLKPNSQTAKEVQKELADLNSAPAPKPTATAKPKAASSH